jgi:Sulfotransferase domain
MYALLRKILLKPFALYRRYSSPRLPPEVPLILPNLEPLKNPIEPIEPVRNPIEPVIVACVTLAHYELIEPFLKEGGFRPVFLVRDTEGEAATEVWPDKIAVFGRPDAVIPVVPLSELATLVQEPRYARVPVIVADAGGHCQAFRSLAPRVAPLLGGQQRLLHPAFLADFVQHDMSGNVLTHGHIGSGNVIFIGIMKRMLAIKHHNRFNQLESWCSSGHILLAELLIKTLNEMGTYQPAIGFDQAGLLTVNSSFEETRTFRLYLRIPSQIHLADYCYGTHSPPQPEAIRRATQRGCKFALLVRHPLDNIVSIAGKYATSMAIPRIESSGDSLAELREGLLAEVLRNEAIINVIISNMAVYLRQAVMYAETATIFRYEDLLADPSSEITRISEFLEIPVSDNTIRELCALVGKKELGPMGHLFRPGSNKWQGTLSPETVDQARACGILKYAEMFGYVDETTGGPSCTSAPLNPANHLSPFSHMYMMDTEEVRAAVAEEHIVTTMAGIEVSAERADDIRKWEQHLATRPYVRQMLRAMSLLY